MLCVAEGLLELWQLLRQHEMVLKRYWSKGKAFLGAWLLVVLFVGFLEYAFRKSESSGAYLGN